MEDLENRFNKERRFYIRNTSIFVRLDSTYVNHKPFKFEQISHRRASQVQSIIEKLHDHLIVKLDSKCGRPQDVQRHLHCPVVEVDLLHGAGRLFERLDQDTRTLVHYVAEVLQTSGVEKGQHSAAHTVPVLAPEAKEKPLISVEGDSTNGTSLSS